MEISAEVWRAVIPGAVCLLATRRAVELESDAGAFAVRGEEQPVNAGALFRFRHPKFPEVIEDRRSGGIFCFVFCFNNLALKAKILD